MRVVLLAALLASSTYVFAHDHAAEEKSSHQPSPFIVDGGLKIYGERLPSDVSTFGVKAILDNPEAKLGSQVKVSGRITQVCQKEGCWMMLAEGDQALRIKFGDHAFFLPKDTTGDAVVYGKLEVRELSVDQAKHMAEDAGQDPAKVTKGLKEYRIFASSVGVAPAS